MYPTRTSLDQTGEHPSKGYYCALCQKWAGHESLAYRHLCYAKHKGALWRRRYNPCGVSPQGRSIRIPIIGTIQTAARGHVYADVMVQPHHGWQDLIAIIRADSLPYAIMPRNEDLWRPNCKALQTWSISPGTYGRTDTSSCQTLIRRTNRTDCVFSHGSMG